MDNTSTVELLTLLHDMAARLEDYLTYDESKGPLKEKLKEELILVLYDIQVSTSNIANDIEKEEMNHGEH